MSKRYSVVKVGGFSHGCYSTVQQAIRSIKNTAEYGFYQVIDNDTGYAVWEGNN